MPAERDDSLALGVAAAKGGRFCFEALRFGVMCAAMAARHYARQSVPNNDNPKEDVLKGNINRVSHRPIYMQRRMMYKV